MASFQLQDRPGNGPGDEEDEDEEDEEPARLDTLTQRLWGDMWERWANQLAAQLGED